MGMDNQEWFRSPNAAIIFDKFFAPFHFVLDRVRFVMRDVLPGQVTDCSPTFGARLDWERSSEEQNTMSTASCVREIYFQTFDNANIVSEGRKKILRVFGTLPMQ
jgi:hypothetical protein